MRKLLTTVLAMAALAAAGAQPAAAQAACSHWQPDESNVIYQGNGWAMHLIYPETKHWFTWANAPGQPSMFGDVMFSSWTADLVRFTITWDNGSGGVYTGRIDENGFVSGTAVDRWTHARTTWHMRDVAICAG